MEHMFGWLEKHRDWAVEVLRMGLGVMLVQKGFFFMQHMDQLLNLVGLRETPWVAGLFAHYIVFAHLVGGAFVILGLITRLSVAIQLPILAGAVVVVYRAEGMMAASSNLEFTFLVFMLLTMFLFYGGGRLSVDAYLAHTAERQKTAEV